MAFHFDAKSNQTDCMTNSAKIKNKSAQVCIIVKVNQTFEIMKLFRTGKQLWNIVRDVLLSPTGQIQPCPKNIFFNLALRILKIVNWQVIVQQYVDITCCSGITLVCQFGWTRFECEPFSDYPYPSPSQEAFN